jgi:hypothetical protein
MGNSLTRSQQRGRNGRESLAYLDAATLLRYRYHHPDSTIGSITTDYVSRIATERYAESCMYHGPQGCVLPRSMRASDCNRYLCDGLVLIAQRLCEEPEVALYVAATEGLQVEAVAALQDQPLSEPQV